MTLFLCLVIFAEATVIGWLWAMNRIYRDREDGYLRALAACDGDYDAR